MNDSLIEREQNSKRKVTFNTKRRGGADSPWITVRTRTQQTTTTTQERGKVGVGGGDADYADADAHGGAVSTRFNDLSSTRYGFCLSYSGKGGSSSSLTPEDAQ